MITLLETGLIDYSDLGILKPVKITLEDLIEIASTTMECNITDEHSNEVISTINNFIVQDNSLKTNDPDFDYKGKGFSPLLKSDLIDKGDYYICDNPVMSSIGLTTKPRNRILYNSIKGETLTDDTQLRQTLDDNRKLTEEIGTLKSHNKQLSKKLKDYEKKIKEFTKTSKETEEKLATLQELENKAKAYDELLESEREELINELTNGDENLAKDYANFTTENLRILKKNQITTRKPRGISSQQTTTTEGDDSSHINDEEYTFEEFEEDFKASGL